MRRLLPILLAAVLAMAGIPHALCACGCSWPGRSESDAATRNRETSCPRCCQHQTRDEGDEAPPAGPKPCRCGSCDERLALVHQSAASGHLSSSDTWQRVVDVALSLPGGAAEAISPRADHPASISFALPVRALPVLLGRLLL